MGKIAMGSINTNSTMSTGPAAPLQMSNKSNAATPKLNSEVEMGSLPGDGQGQEDDIMQVARIGDVPAMEKLFESGDFDATYHDDEGITPLHVSAERRSDEFG
jgi:palmitoyltransferase